LPFLDLRTLTQLAVVGYAGGRWREVEGGRRKAGVRPEEGRSKAGGMPEEGRREARGKDGRGRRVR
jgi:hypothetical protein